MFKSRESEDWNREKLVCGLRQRLQYRTKHWKYGRQEPGFLTRLHHPGWKELESCMLCIQLDHMQRGWKLVVGRGSAHCFCCMGHGRANGNGDNRDAFLGDQRAANDESFREIRQAESWRKATPGWWSYKMFFTDCLKDWLKRWNTRQDKDKGLARRAMNLCSEDILTCSFGRQN